MSLPLCDKIEFNAKLQVTDNLQMKVKRQLYNTMRQGAPMDIFIPKIGMTLGEICCYLVLKEKT